MSASNLVSVPPFAKVLKTDVCGSCRTFNGIVYLYFSLIYYLSLPVTIALHMIVFLSPFPASSGCARLTNTNTKNDSYSTSMQNCPGGR